jgi:hypothetical protein
VCVFGALATQWRVGFAGATGLDYTSIEPVLRLSDIRQTEWPEIFAQIRVMEIEALEQMRLNAEAVREN